MYVINMKNKQKEWHPATKSLMVEKYKIFTVKAETIKHIYCILYCIYKGKSPHRLAGKIPC
jgi:hypothetical protein